MNYQEPLCCFDSSMYTGEPDTAPTEQTMDVPAIIQHLDRLNASGQELQAQAYLETCLAEASALGDWRAELTVTSELLGQYRRSLDKETGLHAVNSVLELLRVHHLGSTVSGATILINAATTMKCFGHASDSLPLFAHAARVYRDHLAPEDYRFAGLYNNMALSYRDTENYSSAEHCFNLAMNVIRHCEHPENELAVTLCNLAELYSVQDPDDPRIGDCMEQAWEALNAPQLPRDGYHAFTVSKCAPTFDYFGFFLYAKQLKERAAEIYHVRQEAVSE